MHYDISQIKHFHYLVHKRTLVSFTKAEFGCGSLSFSPTEAVLFTWHKYLWAEGEQTCRLESSEDASLGGHKSLLQIKQRFESGVPLFRQCPNPWAIKYPWTTITTHTASSTAFPCQSSPFLPNVQHFYLKKKLNATDQNEKFQHILKQMFH